MPVGRSKRLAGHIAFIVNRKLDLAYRATELASWECTRSGWSPPSHGCTAFQNGVPHSLRAINLNTRACGGQCTFKTQNLVILVQVIIGFIL